ncbi:MAG: large conductance mechanosensitive channel protein MscL [Rhodospirillales bacterium]|nr:large conductance mechanosensitive channel protein MscL [Alphaproteobacteria bacterium]MCB9986533.1 large conductance mechanosensitive channel protein MscL [Rhodospirillales bacterium]USO06931.1 MAG: large conductance mechanosensitive channel protein MscL [Rhodospirillales bacterium]
MAFVKEFKEFITRGNVLDMAVGIIIGAAFTAIVSSVVDDVLMPVIGLLLRGIDFSNLFINLSDPMNNTFKTVADAKAAGVATLNYGMFINAVIKFLIIAFAVFVMVKNVNRFMKKPEAAPAAPPAPPEDVVLLREIRDLLKK